MTACILLAGGLGTRLRAALPDVPKCLAPVGARTFLEIQIERLYEQGIGPFVLSLGYLAPQIISLARRLPRRLGIDWFVEESPLGTGGATFFAMRGAGLDEALVANADTLVDGDLSSLLSPLRRRERARMGVMRSPGGGRFGRITVREGRVREVLPPGAADQGLVSAGIYRVHRSAFASRRPGAAFSLETDVLPALASQGALGAAVIAGAFADIGVPEDYRRFCARFAACR